MSISLYEMTAEWQRVNEMLNDPEVPEEAIFDTIEMIELDMGVKAENYAKLIKELESNATIIDGEIKRLRSRRESLENRAAALKANLENMMRVTGRTSFKTPLFSFSIQENGGPRPVVIQSELIPNEYRRPGEPDCAKIRAALDSGEKLWFAAYGERGASLRIR